MSTVKLYNSRDICSRACSPRANPKQNDTYFYSENLLTITEKAVCTAKQIKYSLSIINIRNQVKMYSCFQLNIVFFNKHIQFLDVHLTLTRFESEK